MSAAVSALVDYLSPSLGGTPDAERGSRLWCFVCQVKGRFKVVPGELLRPWGLSTIDNLGGGEEHKVVVVRGRDLEVCS